MMEYNNNYEKEKEIIREVLKRTENGWTVDADSLVLKYLDPFIQDGVDTIVDDGYLLYVDDIKQEMIESWDQKITDEDILQIAISILFHDGQIRKKITERIRQSLMEQYHDYAPIPKRSFQEYVQYADSSKTRKEFDKSYHEYLEAINELYHFCSLFLEKVKKMKQTEKIQHQILELELFMNELNQLKDKEFFKSLTYQSKISTDRLFYQDVFLSEDSKKTLEEVLSQPIDFTAKAQESHFHYSLEDLYQAIPKDVISYELLENEEIDPNQNNSNIEFIQNFYQLALLFCSEEMKDENFEDVVNQFLIQKVSNFQERFYDSCSVQEENEEEYSAYFKDKEYYKKRFS